MEVAPRLPEDLITPPGNEPGVDPPAYPKVAEMARKAEAAIWPSGELDFSKDTRDFETKFTKQQQRALIIVIGFFRRAETTVLENLVGRLYCTVKLHEAREFYGFQIGCEQIHERTYIKIFEALIRDTEERRRVLHMIDELPCVGKKNAWAKKWSADADTPLEVLLLVFACVEGMFFSSSFATIYYVKKYHPNALKGLTASNNLISRDEGMHYKFAVLLLNEVIRNKPSKELIKSIVCEATEIEKEFARVTLADGGFPGLRKDAMVQYVEHVGDYILKDLGCDAHYNVHNPLPYMHMIAMQNKTGFFEHRSTDYKHINMDLVVNKDAMWDQGIEVKF